MKRAPGFVRNLDAPMLRLGPNTYVSQRRFYEAIHVWGSIGSGKSSASGKAIATALLRAGFGGIVCVAKPQEIDRWLDYAKKNGRSNSVIVFDETRGYNFIQHELARQGMRGLANVTETLMTVIEAADYVTGNVGKAGDPFWPASMRQLLNHAIPVLYSAFGTVTVTSILDFVTTAATKPESYQDSPWITANFAGQAMSRVLSNPAVAMPLDVRDAILTYWIREYTSIPEKTRGNIAVSLSAKLDRFRHGRMRSCFSDKTNIVPEMTFHGGIIILAMPALTWNFEGIIGQQLFKYSWQRTVESRGGLDRSQRERGVFLYADEAQYFANSYDDAFLSTCRESRASVVYLTQNLPAYFSRFGREKSDAVESLIGKFNTHIFHLNSCSNTNSYAANLIGRGIHNRANQSRSVGTNRSQGMNSGMNRGNGDSSGGGHGTGGFNHNWGNNRSQGESWGDQVGVGTSDNSSFGTAETMDFVIEPRFFATALKTGGPANGNKVTAVWFRAGAEFEGGGNTMLVTFRQ